MAKHFIDNPENKKEVKFKDGDKMNIHFENLAWATPKENSRLKKECVNKRNSKLTKEDVIGIRGMHPENSYRSIAYKFKVHKSLICRIINRKIWQHI